MSKLTDWFPPNVKPVHVGSYERNYSAANTFWLTGVHYSWWDGKNWNGAYGQAHVCRDESYWQELPWRGLSEKPSGI